jgi:hypothetical protein
MPQLRGNEPILGLNKIYSGSTYLFRDSLEDRVTIATMDVFARFMWIWVIGVLPSDLCFVVRYFPLTSLDFALHRNSYGALY